MPRVSVGMPVFNCERFVGRSIEAVLSQTYGDLELVISDNASTDGTEAVCREYARLDSRIRYVRQAKNLGGPPNFRYVFEIGRGEYQKWNTADDYWDPTFIAKAVEFLDSNPDFVLCYSRTRFIDIDGGLAGTYDDNLDLSEDSPRERFLHLLDVIGLCHADLGLIRRAAMRRTKLMTSERHCDVHFVAELSLYGKFHVLPEYLFFRRLHPQSSSWDLADENLQRTYYDPSGRDRLGMHHWRKYSRLAGSIIRSPVTTPDKASLLVNIARRMTWDRAALGWDLAAAVGWPAVPAPPPANRPPEMRRD